MIKFEYSDNLKNLVEQGYCKYPFRATKGSAGYDLTYPSDSELSIKPGEIKEIDFEVKLSSDKEVFLLVVPRSSMAKKFGLMFTNRDFPVESEKRATAEVYNFTDKTVVVKPGDRLAQAIILPKDLSPRLINGDFMPTKSSAVKLPPSLPKRSFEFQAVKNLELNPRKIAYLMTGIKGRCEEHEFILLRANEELLASRFIVQANGEGIIDSSYFGNPENDGDIGFPLINMGYVPVRVNKGDVVGSAIIYPYCIVDDEEENNLGERKGGFGSTGN